MTQETQQTQQPIVIFKGTFFKQNIKIFTKMLQTMTKLGDEVMFEIEDDKIKAAVMNSSQSTYVLFQIHHKFFEVYRLDKKAQKPEAIRVPIKNLLNIFKTTNTIQSFTIYLTQQYLQFNLLSAQNLSKITRVFFEECHFMTASYDVKTYKSHFQSSIDNFKLMMDTFQNSLEEVCFSLHNNTLDVRSHFDEENGRKMLNSKVSIRCQDFHLYNSTTKKKLEMILSFKDLKPFLSFADSSYVPVDCYLSDNEAPIIFTIAIQNQDNVTDFEGELILATQATNRPSTQTSQTQTSSNSLHSSPNSTPNKSNSNIEKISNVTPEKRKRVEEDDSFIIQQEKEIFKTPERLSTSESQKNEIHVSPNVSQEENYIEGSPSPPRKKRIIE
eukprot:gene6401-10408_t